VTKGELDKTLNFLQRTQSASTRYIFCRLKSGQQFKDFNQKLKETDKTGDSWWRACAIDYAKTIYASTKSRNINKIIFGGRHNWNLYNQKKITKSQWKEARLFPLQSTGEANKNGNRKFELYINKNYMIFKPKCRSKFKLILPKLTKKYREQLTWLQSQAESKLQPVTIQLTKEWISFIFEPKQEIFTTKSNRVLSIDQNPNRLGYSILEYNPNRSFKVLDSGIIDNSNLNKKLGLTNTDKKSKYQTNKRTYEIYQISKWLIQKTKHYQCQNIAIEDLCIKSKDHKKGRAYNRLINNSWNRLKLVSSLTKHCQIHGLKLFKINPAYSSIIGNTLYSNYPDPICAAIEIGRRVFNILYHLEEFYPKVPTKDYLSNLWKKEIGNTVITWKDISSWLKNSKVKYRVSLDSKESRVFRFLNKNSYCNLIRLLV
jgi:IS605 OrfB family transposase